MLLQLLFYARITVVETRERATVNDLERVWPIADVISFDFFLCGSELFKSHPTNAESCFLIK